MKVIINKQEVVGDSFVWDGCHKIYIIEDEEDLEDAKKYDYTDVYDIEEIDNIWYESCDLRFISNWKLDKRYVNQFEKAYFKFINE